MYDEEVVLEILPGYPNRSEGNIEPRFYVRGRSCGLLQIVVPSAIQYHSQRPGTFPLRLSDCSEKHGPLCVLHGRVHGTLSGFDSTSQPE